MFNQCKAKGSTLADGAITLFLVSYDPRLRLSFTGLSILSANGAIFLCSDLS